MLFGDGVGFSGLFATHPPLLDRIQALEPQFTRRPAATRWRRRWMDAAAERAGRRRAPRACRARSGARLPAAGVRVQRHPADGGRAGRASVGRTITGAPTRSSTAIPEALRDLAAQRDAVMPLLLGLLLDGDEAVAALQREEIAARLGPAVADHAQRIARSSCSTSCTRCCACRWRRSPSRYCACARGRTSTSFLDTVHAVVHADGQVSLFEYCLGRLLHVQVRESLDPSRHARFGRTQVSRTCAARSSTLLCVVAQAATTTRADCAARLPRRHPARAAARPLPYLPREEGVLALDEVWARARCARPAGQAGRWSKAITAAISHDGRVSVAEAELLRTICAVLHCPLPPMLERT